MSCLGGRPFPPAAQGWRLCCIRVSRVHFACHMASNFPNMATNLPNMVTCAQSTVACNGTKSRRESASLAFRVTGLALETPAQPVEHEAVRSKRYEETVADNFLLRNKLGRDGS